MRRLIDNIPRDAYKKELAAFLAKQSGKPRGDISKAIARTKKGGWEFEKLLEELEKNE
jgi:uncharacterized protein YbjT (DUF2867 family)